MSKMISMWMKMKTMKYLKFKGREKGRNIQKDRFLEMIYWWMICHQGSKNRDLPTLSLTEEEFSHKIIKNQSLWIPKTWASLQKWKKMIPLWMDRSLQWAERIGWNLLPITEKKKLTMSQGARCFLIAEDKEILAVHKYSEPEKIQYQLNSNQWMLIKEPRSLYLKSKD